MIVRRYIYEADSKVFLLCNDIDLIQYGNHVYDLIRKIYICYDIMDEAKGGEIDDFSLLLYINEQIDDWYLYEYMNDCPEDDSKDESDIDSDEDDYEPLHDADDYEAIDENEYNLNELRRAGIESCYDKAGMHKHQYAKAEECVVCYEYCLKVDYNECEVCKALTCNKCKLKMWESYDSDDEDKDAEPYIFKCPICRSKAFKKLKKAIVHNMIWNSPRDLVTDFKDINKPIVLKYVKNLDLAFKGDDHEEYDVHETTLRELLTERYARARYIAFKSVMNEFKHVVATIE